jgi:hypothetical protein
VEWVRRCARWGRAAAKAETSMVVVVEDELGWWKRMEGTASGPRRGKAGLCGRSGEDGRPPPPRAREGGGWRRGDSIGYRLGRFPSPAGLGVRKRVCGLGSGMDRVGPKQYPTGIKSRLMTRLMTWTL